MSKAIIIEGMNGSGKSVLAKKLANYFDKLYYHPGLGPQNIIHLIKSLDEQIYMINNGKVIDRTVLFSEQVYGNGKLVPNMFLDNLAKELADKYVLIYKIY